MDSPHISFSVITASRNAAGHIARCLESVDRQTHPRVEHVIVDGGSTDGTQAIVKARSGRVTKLVSEADQGIYDAMNKGIALASGDYLVFLGADDALADDTVLADVATFLEREGRPDVVYGDLEVREGKAKSVFHPPPPDEALPFLVCGCLPHQSTVAHARVFRDLGPFDLRYRIHADYDWFLRVITAPGLKVRSMSRVIGSFASGGASTAQLRRGQEEVYAIQNALPLFQQPEWIARRLHTFQQRTLDLRLRLQEAESTSIVDFARRLGGRMKRVLFSGSSPA
jgi:glycosyltransferase involved in cell wall biosynthesis